MSLITNFINIKLTLSFFILREIRTKEDVLTHDNGTISYRETRSYTFDESSSVGPESTNITTMNIVYMVNKILLM